MAKEEGCGGTEETMSRQSQDLDKFWLGNVDKNWEVEEDQGYEEEEKEGLLKTTAESKLTRDAVDEGDVRAARDDDMAIDTVKVGRRRRLFRGAGGGRGP